MFQWKWSIIIRDYRETKAGATLNHPGHPGFRTKMNIYKPQQIKAVDLHNVLVPDHIHAHIPCGESYVGNTDILFYMAHNYQPSLTP